MPDIEYPYMPEGRFFKYVSADNPFMKEASHARETMAGDPSYPVGGVLVKEGKIIGKAGNGYNRGRQVHVCPRLVLECPSGTGYDLCDLHGSDGHSEPMTIAAAHAAGEDIEGADFYMYGHWWACEPCWTKLIDAGVRDVYVVDDAHERFSRDKVYGAFLTPTVKSAYIAGPITNVVDFGSQASFYEALGSACEEMGCAARIPHRDNALNENRDAGNSRGVYDWASNESRVNDVVVAEVSQPSLGTGGELVVADHAKTPIVLLSKKGSRVSRYVLGNPSVVYHIEYENQEDACHQLKNVLKQL